MSATLPPTSSTIHIRDLRFRYPGSTHEILRIPSLDIGGRGLIALTGPSGAGKSTLVELLAGTLREEYDGSVEVLGTELKTLTSDAARQRHIRRIGFIPQDYGLLPGRTVLELLHQDLDDAEVPRTEQSARIIAALTQVGLLEFANRPSNQLSGGQRQRVAIARMLARDVEMVVADEPTANLDPSLTDEIIELLRTLGKRVSVIIVTHDSRVAEMCDRTIVLQAAAVWDSANVLASTTNGDHGISGLSRRAWIAIAASIVLGLGLIAVVVAENRFAKSTRLTTPTTSIQQAAQAPATLSRQSITSPSPGALVQQQVTAVATSIPTAAPTPTFVPTATEDLIVPPTAPSSDPLQIFVTQQGTLMVLQTDGPVDSSAFGPSFVQVDGPYRGTHQLCHGLYRGLTVTVYDSTAEENGLTFCQQMQPASANTTATTTTGASSQTPTAQSTIDASTSSASPSVSEIAFEMSRTIESDDNDTHFTPVGQPLTIPDGSEGTLTAMVGVRYPTADGYGQLVFFWHNDKFLGWNSAQETISIQNVASSAPGIFDVTYTQYAATDPLASPSLPPVTISYQWNGSGLQSSGTPPNLDGSVQMLP